MGLADLIAGDSSQYLAIAIRLANDVQRLIKLRQTLRERMRGSLITDAVRFTRELESTYRVMWSKWCQTKSAATANFIRKS